MIAALIGPILKATLGAWLNGRKERAQAEHQQYLKELEMGLHDPNKLRALKWATFLQFSAPVWLGLYDPALLDKVLAALGALPDWYVEAYLMIVGGIWAGAVGKDIIEALIKSYRRSK